VKRALIVIGIAVALIGISVILPASANYGRSGPMAIQAVRSLVLGSVITAAGGGAIFFGARARKRNA